jgi:RNA-directed DNA polymerase
MQSNWRSPPHPVAKSAEQGSRITGHTGKSAEDERVAAGSAVARKQGNAGGAKGPCCLYLIRQRMIKTPISLQDLRRTIYVKAKAEPTWRFWGLYVHVCKMETLHEAYRVAKQNHGAPGIDGVTFAAIEIRGMESFLNQIRDELVSHTFQPMPARKREIPKDGGTKVRVIPCIRDRVVQGALKLILEPIFEADFQPG